MRWHKVARLLVAAIGLGCGWWVYSALRPREVSPGITAAPPLIDDTVTSTSRKGEELVVDPTTGLRLRKLEYEELRTLADGRTVFTGVTLSFNHNGVPYTVEAGEAEAKGQAGPAGEMPDTVNFRGSVHMHGEDGFCVEAQSATYLGGEQRINFPGEVAFTRDRLSGRGIGADLYMDRAVFWMYGDSTLTVAPERGSVGVVATGNRIGLADTDHYLRIEEGARLTRRGQHELASSTMMVYFADTSQDVRRIELDDQAIVRHTGSGNGPDMRAARINLDFAAAASLLTHAQLEGGSTLTLREDSGSTRVSGTDMELYIGPDGQTLKQLRATGPVEVALPRNGDTPARTISASNLVADGSDAKGLERADFSGGVTYREARPATPGRPQADRVATARQMLLSLGGALNEVQTAAFRREVSLKDDTVTATGDEGQYDPNAGTLQLKAADAARAPARVIGTRMDVRAGDLDVQLSGEGIKARGAVRSVMSPDTATQKSGTETGLFEKGSPIAGNADALTYSKATGIASYVGNVTLFQRTGTEQEGTLIKAKDVQLNELKEDLTATGGVSSTLLVAGTPDAADQAGLSRTTLTADRLDYLGATRTAKYSGTAVMVSADGQRLTADTISLTLYADRRALERLEATAAPKGEVRATLPESRQTTGLALTYTAANETYVVTGEPARFVSRAESKGPNVCEVFQGSELEFQRASRVATVRNEGGAFGRARDMKCSEVMK